VGASYDAFGSERYVLTFDNRKFREAAAFAPYEFVEILANNNTYGAVASTTCTAPWLPTACGRPTSSCTSSGTILPRLPTSTTPPMSL